MTNRAELYLAPVAPRWPRLCDLVAALGCVVERVDMEVWYERTEKDTIDLAPREPQLCRDLRTIIVPRRLRLSPRVWAHIAHEAVHARVGAWSFDDETPMLPHELELSRRVANAAERRACYRYLGNTWLSESYHCEIVDQHEARWQTSVEWQECIAAGDERGLPRDGRLPGEDRV